MRLATGRRGQLLRGVEWRRVALECPFHGLADANYFVLFFFKQKTAYDIPKRDWSSDVCSSDLDDHQRSRAPVVFGVDRQSRTTDQARAAVEVSEHSRPDCGSFADVRTFAQSTCVDRAGRHVRSWTRASDGPGRRARALCVFTVYDVRLLSRSVSAV